MMDNALEASVIFIRDLVCEKDVVSQGTSVIRNVQKPMDSAALHSNIDRSQFIPLEARKLSF
jgi:hypothetical protein